MRWAMVLALRIINSERTAKAEIKMRDGSKALFSSLSRWNRV